MKVFAKTLLFLVTLLTLTSIAFADGNPPAGATDLQKKRSDVSTKLSNVIRLVDNAINYYGTKNDYGVGAKNTVINLVDQYMDTAEATQVSDDFRKMYEPEIEKQEKAILDRCRDLIESTAQDIAKYEKIDTDLRATKVGSLSMDELNKLDAYLDQLNIDVPARLAQSDKDFAGYWARLISDLLVPFTALIRKAIWACYQFT